MEKGFLISGKPRTCTYVCIG